MRTKMFVLTASLVGGLSVGCQERSKTPENGRPAAQSNPTSTTVSARSPPTSKLGPVASNAGQPNPSDSPSPQADIDIVRNEMDRFAAKLEEVTDFFAGSGEPGPKCVFPPDASPIARPTAKATGANSNNGGKQ